ncbi:MAG: PAS domain S-box protein [Fimbriimonadaceae bacterium]|nr:PAS domain S-box protein [Fimbriimonadaceae bacterium]
MTEEGVGHYTDEVRAAAAGCVSRVLEQLEPTWRASLETLGAELGSVARAGLVEGLMGFLPRLPELLEGPGRAAAEVQLSIAAEEAYHARVPYALLSKGLRILKRLLIRAALQQLPETQPRAAVCDLLEEQIDESRVLVNSFYYTFHERKLRDSEALTRFLLNNTYDAVYLVELRSGCVVLCNAQAVELTGLSQQQLAITRFTDLVVGPRRDEVGEALRRVAVAGSRRFDEVLIQGVDGQIHKVMLQLTMVPHEEQQVAQVSVRDTSQESLALAETEREAAYLRAAVTETAEAVMTIDTDNRLRSWNKGAREVFGYTADEILNRPADVLMPPEVIESGELERLTRLVNERGFVRNFESVRLTKDGRRIDVEVTRTAIFDPHTGKRLGTSAVVRDISEKKRLEREAARKTRQLETMNRILAATSRIIDRDQTFRTIASQIEGLLPLDAMTVCLPEAEAERLRCRVLLGDAGLVVGSERLIDRDATLHGRALAAHRSLRIGDLTTLGNPGPDDIRLADLGFRSALISPLVYNAEAMGSLMLLHRRPEAYDEADRLQLDHLASHFAVILDNARRYEEERKRSAQFELISRVGAAAIANIGDAKRLMKSVVDTIQTDFGYYDVAVYEVAEEAQVFRLRAQAGHRRGALGESFEQPLAVGVFGEVLRTQTSYVANDVLLDPHYFDPSPVHRNVRSELCVPIRLGPQVFGVLDVESQRPNRFDRLDRAAMEALAGLLARCMEADESLRQTKMLQAMRHNIMEAVPSALILLDDDLRVKFVNRRYCEFFGQSVNEIMHRHASEVFPASLLEESRFFELVTRLQETQRPIDQREVRYFDFAGAERYADVRLRIVREYETSVIVMLHDATLRLKRLYQLSMLQDIGEEMQRTLDSERLLQAILTCVTAGPGFGFNRATLFLYDRERDRLVESLRVGPSSPAEAGEIWHQLGHKKSLREFLREYDRTRGARRPAREEARVVVPVAAEDDHLRRWRAPILLREGDEEDLALGAELRRFSGAAELLVVPLVSQESVLGLIVADNLFTRDPISRDSIRMLSTFANQAGVALANAQAFEKLETSIDELTRTQNKLAQAERLAGIGQVAAHVAHEIRNPLVSIGGFARMVGERADQPAYVRSRSAIIVKEVKRLEQILRNVADFTAPGKPELAWLSINDLVRDVISLQQPVFEDTQTTVGVTLADDLPQVEVDGGKIKQVVLNLVRNAVQAMAPGGQLTVHTGPSRDGKSLEIRVGDSGPGIPPDRLEEIFNPFFTNKADGTGLGLAVSRKIVNDHGGNLIAESRAGDGATFIIQLPLPEHGESAAEAEESTNGQ